MSKAATPSRVPPLRAVRRAQGRSLRNVAAEAGIDPTHLSRVEHGHKQLSTSALLRLGRVLGLTDLVRHLELYVLDENGDRS